VTSSEGGAGWPTFFRDLVARGLAGVELVTSDAHAGLVAAIGATLPGAAWQRCRTHTGHWHSRRCTSRFLPARAGYDVQARAVVWTQDGWQYQPVSGLDPLPNSTSLAGFTPLQ
jgi:hypothetical protein